MRQGGGPAPVGLDGLGKDLVDAFAFAGAAGRSRRWEQAMRDRIPAQDRHMLPPMRPSADDPAALWELVIRQIVQDEEQSGWRKESTPVSHRDYDRWFGELSLSQMRGEFNPARTGDGALDPAGVVQWHQAQCRECQPRLSRHCGWGRGIIGLAVHGLRREAILRCDAPRTPTQAMISAGRLRATRASEVGVARFERELVEVGVVRSVAALKGT